MKLCKDCKHCRVDFLKDRSLASSYSCTRLEEINTIICPVLGSIVKEVVKEATRCIDERASSDKCSPSGKFFEPDYSNQSRRTI